MALAGENPTGGVTELSYQQLGFGTPHHQHDLLQTATHSHIASFNYMLDEALPRATADLDTCTMTVDGRTVNLLIRAIRIGVPQVASGKGKTALLPSECRERRITYAGELQLEFVCDVDGQEVVVNKAVGDLPIMVKSSKCHLSRMNARDLVDAHEEAEEMGGYFVVNGNEKIIRMLLIPRRNFVMALIRPSFANRGSEYTEYGTQIRCVRGDESSQNLQLHYRKDGTCDMGFSYRKQQYLVPGVMLLRAFVDMSDREIFDAIVQGDTKNTFVTERVELMLSILTEKSLFRRDDCIRYLGNRFKIVLNLPELTTDEQAGEELLRRIMFVHLEDDMGAKFQLQVLMIRKLFALVSGDCAPDNADSQMNQELLLPGHLYSAFIKEQCNEYLQAVQKTIQTDVRLEKSHDCTDDKYIKKVLQRAPNIGKKVAYLLTTGNISSPSGLGLMQASGMTIIADKLNFQRYMSHFRCVHRGGYFTQMKTTSVRKLLGEAWGFLCPVHTPDGSPCGLLLHLARSCVPSNTMEDTMALPNLLYTMGVLRLGMGYLKGALSVVLDGKVIGFTTAARARSIATQLRLLKVDPKNEDVSPWLEIGLVLPSSGGQFPGLHLFSTPARMMRSVVNLHTKSVEWIGTMEQVYLDVCVCPEEYIPGVTTHMEQTSDSFLSIIASMTPFSDFNQSPRNMYQCQMGKQTMGVPALSMRHRADNKMYSLNTPQTPMVRPIAYDQYAMNTYPTGTNAIVAVIAYTGYDMEDAMIVNKSSMERGFAHAQVIATKLVDLDQYKEQGEAMTLYFGNPDETVEGLEFDGFPTIGTKILNGDPLYGYVDSVTGKAKVQRYKGEPAFIKQVSLLGTSTRATIKLAINRNPIIGDKFASRHGQKGILSQLWPAHDMPFTESGMMPDILFNPHGFPSRMTIGMLIESMAGKAAALYGTSYQAQPFQFSESETALDFFGKQLADAGYSYHGHERLYSGTTGLEFEADIFIGAVYYQRLRHMVSDKFQVRTIGPVHNLTQQPIKGRKRAGGIRFGEMERDALLGHGVSALLQDRLVNCSDASTSLVCTLCGSLVSPIQVPSRTGSWHKDKRCRACDTDRGVVSIDIPYVFRFLTAELLAMNIRLTLDIQPVTA